MKAFFSTTGKVHPGQLDAAIASSADGAKVVGSHGGDVRFYLEIASGEQAETTLFSVEYESPEDMARAMDEMNTDPELHRLRTTAAGSTLVSTTMGIELPTGHTSKGGRGNILEVHLSTVTPGRMEQFVSETADVSAFVEANGALNARALQLTYAGMSSGLVCMLWEHTDMAAQAKVGAAWFTKPGLAIQEKGLGANAASTRAGSMLYHEIPL